MSYSYTFGERAALEAGFGEGRISRKNRFLKQKEHEKDSRRGFLIEEKSPPGKGGFGGLGPENLEPDRISKLDRFLENKALGRLSNFQNFIHKGGEL